MISIGNNEAVICKGDFRPAQFYKGETKIAGYTVEEFQGTGSVMLENCYNDKVYDAQISENSQSITVRGKNYFDINKISKGSTTIPYNNGLRVEKTAASNRGNKIPITLPVGKTIYITMDVVDSQINGTATRVTMGFYNSKNTLVGHSSVSSTVAHKSYTVTLSEEISYIQFYFQASNSSNAVGDYVTMDNIMIRTEGDDSYEPHIEPRIINVGSDIPSFKGTTIIETDEGSTISGKYKKKEG